MMQIVFLKSVITEALGFNSAFNPYDRYKMSEDSITKVTTSRYEINTGHIKTVMQDIIDVYSVAKCIPAFVGDEEYCKEFEKSVLTSFSKIKATDVLWIEPEVINISGERIYNSMMGYVSARVYLRNGKSFLIAKKVPNKLHSGKSTDYNVIKPILSQMTQEDLNTTRNISNYAKVILDIINCATNVTMQELCYQMFREYKLFDSNESVGMLVGGKPKIFHTLESMSDDLYTMIYEDDEIFEKVYITSRFNNKFTYGLWRDEDGNEYHMNNPNRTLKLLGDLNPNKVITLEKVR